VSQNSAANKIKSDKELLLQKIELRIFIFMNNAICSEYWTQIKFEKENENNVHLTVYLLPTNYSSIEMKKLITRKLKVRKLDIESQDMA
jgi:hypothetical protein